MSRNADNDFADLIRVPETGLISDVSLKFLIYMYHVHVHVYYNAKYGLKKTDSLTCWIPKVIVMLCSSNIVANLLFYFLNLSLNKTCIYSEQWVLY